MEKANFIFFALSPTGSGISGSDRIFIELAREWSVKTQIRIFTTQEGIDMMGRQKLTSKYLEIERVEDNNLPRNFFLKYIYKIFLGIKLGLTIKLPVSRLQLQYLYSSSDFWMDVLPAVLVKIRFNKVRWVATWYQTAPNPLVGFKEGRRERSYLLSALVYWLSQLPTRPLINRYADFVVVNNEYERSRFPELDKKGKVIVLIGAVRLDEIKRYLTSHSYPHSQFDAVFQGRFHPQKGVVELIDIWKKVVEKKPDAKLAMIGDGPLMNEVKSQITKHKLQRNVKLFGYVFDGPKKYKIFSQSKVVVHPAFYDSGGMASAEAMAFGLPAVGFNLKAYDSYYPQGMVKVKKGDLDVFTKAVVRLLDDEDERGRLGKQALEMIEANWSWDKRAEEVFKDVNQEK